MNHTIAYSAVAAIAMLVVLSIMALKSRTDSVSVAVLQTRTSKNIMLNLAATLERDLRNVGSNFPAYDLEPDSAVVSWKVDSTANYFSFIGQAKPGQPPAVIRFEWRAADSAIVQGELKSLYEVSRFVDGELRFQTAPLFTSVSFSFLTDDGQPAADAGELRQIGIELKAIGSLGVSEAVPETRWDAVYRPIALARNDNEDI